MIPEAVRKPMEPPSPYGRLVVHRLPSGPVLKSVADLIEISQELIDEVDESPYMELEGDTLTIRCTNATVVYELGPLNDKGMRRARFKALESATCG